MRDSEAFYANILVVDNADRVVGLQTESSLIDLAGEVGSGLLIGGFLVIRNRLTIHFHGDMAAFDDDMLGPPFVILGGSFLHVDDIIDAAGFLPVAMGNIDLGFEPVLGPAFVLVTSMEVDAAIGVLLGHHIDLEFEVFERRGVTDVEVVTAAAIGSEGAVDDAPGTGAFADPPPGPGAIEYKPEAFGVYGAQRRFRRRGGDGHFTMGGLDGLGFARLGDDDLVLFCGATRRQQDGGDHQINRFHVVGQLLSVPTDLGNRIYHVNWVESFGVGESLRRH